VSEDLSRQAPALVEGEDFYREGAYVVFTARYHLRRGRCCESGCRHCPYRVAEKGAAVVEKEGEDGASL
jgi:2-iminoacetate synthase ThiH